MLGAVLRDFNDPVRCLDDFLVHSVHLIAEYQGVTFPGLRGEPVQHDRVRACSTQRISYPSARSFSIASIVRLQYSQSTLNSAPRADLWISADGGVAHMPQRKTLSALNESALLNTEPTL